MKNNLLKGILVSSVVFLAIACSPKNETPPPAEIDKEMVKQEIQARENEYAELYNTRQLKDIGYYAEDAISYSQNKAPLVGKSAIVEYLKTNIDTAAPANKISFTTNEVFVSPDGINVVEIGYYKLVDSADSIINTGNYMSIFEKRDGKYVCLRDMSTSDIPFE